MEETLLKLGMGEKMLGCISALYHNPEAGVKVNGALSFPLRVCNVTELGRVACSLPC